MLVTHSPGAFPILSEPMATFLPDPRVFPAPSISLGTLCPAFPCGGEEGMALLEQEMQGAQRARRVLRKLQRLPSPCSEPKE